MLGRAISIASLSFSEKVDRGGQPYILHCLRVMNKMSKHDEELRCAAVLHDLIEDTDWTLEDLRQSAFSDRVVTAVKLLTKTNDVDYDTYIHRISQNINATLIKLADIEDNSDVTRLKGLRDKDFERMKKYHRSYLVLKEAKINLQRR